MLDPTRFIMEYGSLVTIKRKTVKEEAIGAVVANSPTPTVFKTNLTEATDDYYKDMELRFTSGTLTSENSSITAYVGSTKQITVSPAFSEAPIVTDAFIIEGLYGDSPVIWTTDQEQERVMIQTAGKGPGINPTLAGNIEGSTLVGRLLPSSTIIKGCILETGGLRYKVDRVISSRIDDSKSLKTAHLSLLEEGK